MLRLIENPTFIETAEVSSVIRALYSRLFNDAANQLDAMTGQLASMPHATCEDIKARTALIIERSNFAHATMMVIRRETPECLIRNAVKQIRAQRAR